MRTSRLILVPLVVLGTSGAALAAGVEAPAAPDPRVAQARALTRAGKAEEARQALRGVVASDPKNREARKALLEAAALLKDWNECNAQTALLEPFADGEEVSMFYAAVALRETGSIASARALVVRARPFLKPSRFVDWYTKEILGSATTP